MSAGAFILSRYQADNGDIHPIRIQPETALANVGGVNSPPAGAADVAVFARTGGGKREYAKKARSVSVRFTGAAPDGYAPNTTLRIPILTSSIFDDIIPGGTTGTYLGSPVIVIGKQAESGR